jgi:2-oxoglutarate ferredoxin oxidoreductase subunit delta
VANSTRKAARKFRGEVFINRERCKGCGFCVEFCPTHVLQLEEGFNHKGYHAPIVVDADACTGCDLCGLYCPDFAIHGIKVKTDNGGNEERDHAHG